MDCCPIVIVQLFANKRWCLSLCFCSGRALQATAFSQHVKALWRSRLLLMGTAEYMHCSEKPARQHKHKPLGCWSNATTRGCEHL